MTAKNKTVNFDLIADIERQIEPFETAWKEKNKIPEGSVGSRQLTDAEVNVLAKSYDDGKTAMKNHPWNMGDADHEYWKKPARKNS